MGKATIIAGGTGGLYLVNVEIDTSRVSVEIAKLTDQITELTAAIAEMDEGIKKDMANLQLKSRQKRKEFLENALNETGDSWEVLWCADFSENLSGEVGTIECIGQRAGSFDQSAFGTKNVIRPGFDENAVWAEWRDGNLQPAIGGTPASVFYNWAMMPGVQKWRNQFRTATISNVDKGAGTCTIALEVASSSEQALNVNQDPTIFHGVQFEYMDCDAMAFEDGDEVIVRMPIPWGGTWARVIGFQQVPRPCCYWQEDFESSVDWSWTKFVGMAAVPISPPYTWYLVPSWTSVMDVDRDVNFRMDVDVQYNGSIEEYDDAYPWGGGNETFWTRISYSYTQQTLTLPEKINVAERWTDEDPDADTYLIVEADIHELKRTPVRDGDVEGDDYIEFTVVISLEGDTGAGWTTKACIAQWITGNSGQTGKIFYLALREYYEDFGYTPGNWRMILNGIKIFARYQSLQYPSGVGQPDVPTPPVDGDVNVSIHNIKVCSGPPTGDNVVEGTFGPGQMFPNS